MLTQQDLAILEATCAAKDVTTSYVYGALFSQPETWFTSFHTVSLVTCHDPKTCYKAYALTPQELSPETVDIFDLHLLHIPH